MERRSFLARLLTGLGVATVAPKLLTTEELINQSSGTSYSANGLTVHRFVGEPGHIVRYNTVAGVGGKRLLLAPIVDVNGNITFPEGYR